jgi:site-specific recombinase XerD
LWEQAQEYARRSRSSNTWRAYQADWSDFAGWCERHELQPAPAAPETVVLYLTDLARTRKPGTLTRRLVAINQFHILGGWTPPAAGAEIRAVMAGIRRTAGSRQSRKKPLLPEHLRRAVDGLPDTLLGCRNRALLLLGLAGALRRSELVALDWSDIERVAEEGIQITVTRSKTDPEGKGRVIGIPFGRQAGTCPARALESWREAGGVNSGAIFRVIGRTGRALEERLSDRAVARVVKQAAEAAGLDPKLYGGHSLRAGLATAAAAAGVSERSIMQQTGHKDVTTVRRYIRQGELFHDNAAGGIGL